jgi:hypothetical protein
MHKSRLLWLLAVLVVGGVILLVLELTNTTHLFHSKPAAKLQATTGGANTKGAGQASSNQSSGLGTQSTNTSSPSSASKQPNSSPVSSTPLQAPWGTFANVYTAKLNEQMESTCNTTSGATCQIFFTSGDTTKSLDVETTDAGGAVYWAWTPASVGLTPGVWHLTMRAVLGSQTKSTSNDPLTLTVTQ